MSAPEGADEQMAKPIGAAEPLSGSKRQRTEEDLDETDKGALPATELVFNLTNVLSNFRNVTTLEDLLTCSTTGTERLTALVTLLWLSSAKLPPAKFPEIYLPLHSSILVTRDDKQRCVDYEISGHVYGSEQVEFLYDCWSSGYRLRAKLGDLPAFYLPDFKVEDGYFLTRTQRRHLPEIPTGPMDTFTTNVAVLLTHGLNVNNLPTLPTICGNLLNLLKTVTVGYDVFNSIFPIPADSNIQAQLLNLLDNSFYAGNLWSGFILALLAFTQQCETQQDKWDAFADLVATRPGNNLMVQQISSLYKLHLPALPPALNEFQYTDKTDLATKETMQLSESDCVLLGTLPAPGTSVSAFLRKPPSAVYVFDSSKKLMRKSKGRRGVESLVPIDFKDTKLDTLEGKTLKKFLGSNVVDTTVKQPGSTPSKKPRENLL